MTALERNGDLVRLSAYAPLLGKRGRLAWEPDLIYFDNSAIYPTINYAVQQLFSLNAGDRYLPTSVIFEDDKTLAASCVQDSESGDLIIKIVSRASEPVRTQIDFSGAGNIQPDATCTVLSAEPMAENSYSHWRSRVVVPESKEIAVAPQFAYDVPAHSLTVIRMKTHLA